MNAEQTPHVFDITSRALKVAPDLVVQRHIDNCTAGDPEYGAGVAAPIVALG